MKKYSVTVPYAVFVTVEVEAESKDEAIGAAVDEIYITNYAGNGGLDKLLGVSSGSIEANEMPLEDGGFRIEAEEAFNGG